MAVLWRCAVASFVVALFYQPFTLQMYGLNGSWWEQLTYPFWSLAWGWFGLQHLATLFVVGLLTSWLTARWVGQSQSSTGTRREAPNLQTPNWRAEKRGPLKSLFWILLISLLVALLAPLVTMPLSIISLGEIPVPKDPDAPFGPGNISSRPFESWWDPILSTFRIPGVLGKWAMNSKVFFPGAVFSGLISAVWPKNGRLGYR